MEFVPAILVCVPSHAIGMSSNASTGIRIVRTNIPVTIAHATVGSIAGIVTHEKYGHGVHIAIRYNPSIHHGIAVPIGHAGKGRRRLRKGYRISVDQHWHDIRVVVVAAMALIVAVSIVDEMARIDRGRKVERMIVPFIHSCGGVHHVHHLVGSDWD